MKDLYEEMIDGLPLLRLPTSARHDIVCRRLHDWVGAALSASAVVRLLLPRAPVRLAPGTVLRPDLAVVTWANGRLWLAAEVIEAEDHHADTVTKKALYEDLRIPRLWMVDPRYDNVEVYHATVHGLKLMGSLTGPDRLTEPLLGGINSSVAEFFAD